MCRSSAARRAKPWEPPTKTSHTPRQWLRMPTAIHVVSNRADRAVLGANGCHIAMWKRSAWSRPWSSPNLKNWSTQMIRDSRVHGPCGSATAARGHRGIGSCCVSAPPRPECTSPYRLHRCYRSTMRLEFQRIQRCVLGRNTRLTSLMREGHIIVKIVRSTHRL